jgi:two-component system OmpR family response regulator
LHGDLDQIGLPTVLTILDMERRSGLLLIRRNGEIARFWISAGHVIRAQTERPRRSGKAAVFQVLGWAEGRFELSPAEVDGPDEIATPTTHLLMEAARRIDEAGASLPG